MREVERWIRVEGSARGRVATKVQKKKKRTPTESEKKMSRTIVRRFEEVELRPDIECLSDRTLVRSTIAARNAAKAETKRYVASLQGVKFKHGTKGGRKEDIQVYTLQCNEEREYCER
jgi:hypothetical protein